MRGCVTSDANLSKSDELGQQLSVERHLQLLAASGAAWIVSTQPSRMKAASDGLPIVVVNECLSKVKTLTSERYFIPARSYAKSAILIE